MDRKYPLEAQLLSRSHDTHRVVELLTQRYAVNDKPMLSLRPTTGVKKTKKKKAKTRSLVAQIMSKKTAHQLSKRNDQTKFVFKNFLRRSMYAERMLKYKVSKLKREGHAIDEASITKFKEYSQIPKYDDFLQLNLLWTQYIQDLLQVEQLKGASSQPVLSKLSSADFNGCFLNVLKSKNKQLVDSCGIVVWDSKNFFIVVKPDNGLKMLEKKGTMFNFIVPLYNVLEPDGSNECMEFTIIGTRFQYRSSDRAGRKFKAKSVVDLDM